MSTTSRKSKRRTQHPQVLVSRVGDQPAVKVSRNANVVRQRLAAGASLVVIDTGGETIELGDKELRDASQDWTLRIIGTSKVRIHRSAPLPRTAQIVATDGSFVEITGHVTLHAYTHTTVHAFDKCTVHARNNTTVSACDAVTVIAVDEATVMAYDTAHVHASGRAVVTAGDRTSIHLDEAARASVQRSVVVTGPARLNLTVRR
ncbi:hypothetical protein [Prescottella equi]|uniref:hypothetical protein n=1 Tax=Rhodococcus hoagii TaxID=43767 RepID=UPI00384AD48B